MMIHKGLTPERWHKFSLMMQLANVGCDVDRALREQQRGEHTDAQRSFERAIELFNLTVIDPKNSGPRRREILRARETFIDFFLGENQYGSTYQLIYDYFYAFSYAAALERGR